MSSSFCGKKLQNNSVKNLLIVKTNRLTKLKISSLKFENASPSKNTTLIDLELQIAKLYSSTPSKSKKPSSSSVWKVLGVLQTFLNYFWQLPVKVLPESEQLISVHGFCLRWFCFSWGVMSCLWGYTVLLVYKMIVFTEDDPEFTPVTAICCVLILSDCLSALSISYTLFVYRDDFVFIINNVKQLIDEIVTSGKLLLIFNLHIKLKY